MSSSSISNSNRLKLLKRLLLFLFGLVASYVLIVFSISIIPINNSSLFKVVIGNLSQTGGHGQTLKRFREVENTGEVDILFIGSSHSYRSFDPKVFSRLGLRTINLGSSSQTPINSYFLLEKYYKKLNPKLVIFEMYPTVLQLDGLEGLYDLIANTKLDKHLLNMTLAVDNMHGYNSLVEQYLSSFIHPFESYKQADMPNEQYVDGGYLHSEIIYFLDYFGTSGEINISDTQAEYFNKTINYIKDENGKLLILIAPLPKERITTILNYKAVQFSLDSLAQMNNILFYDFNKTITLNSKTDFRDHNHLNANGAKIFSYALLDSLLDVTEFNQSLKFKPKFATEVYTGRGITMVSQYKFIQAEKDFTKAIELDSKNFKALLNLGLLHARQLDYLQAIDNFEQALKLNSKSFDAHYNMASNLELIGERKKAIEHYQQALKYLPPKMIQFKQGITQKISSLK